MNIEQTGWNAALVFVSLATIVSNSSTLFIFTRKEFKRKQSYYLPMNLAVTDLLIGTAALPLYICLINLPQLNSKAVHNIYKTVDITAGLTSLSTIAVIALERLYAVGFPLQHRLLEPKHYITSISLTWLYGFVLMAVLVYVPSANTKNDLVMQAYLVLFGIGSPVLITLVAYSALFVVTRRSLGNLQVNVDMNRDKKLAGTLLIVTVVFFLTWMPFAVLNFVLLNSNSSGSTITPPMNSMEITKLLQYSNSFANFIIYTLRSPSFLVAFKKIFKCGRFKGRMLLNASITVKPARDELELHSYNKGPDVSTLTLTSLA